MVVFTAACTLVCSLIAAPAQARPDGATVPDAGARPVAGGPVSMPGYYSGGSTVVGPPVLGPLATQIMAETTAVQSIGEQLKQAELDMGQARDTYNATERTLREAEQRLAEARERADNAAADAYKAATEMGPLDGFAGELHKFSLIAPGLSDRPGGQAAARELLRAEQEERSAREAFQMAGTVHEAASGRHDTLKVTFDQRSSALLDLRTRNASELARIEAERDAYEQSLGGVSLSNNVNMDGYKAHASALAAVQYALNQLGKPYLWGAEGPDRFDCSGLAFAAYKSVGRSVPRVANSMYNGTPKVTATKLTRGDLLVPGDLVFFATDATDWRSIHHMGIYIGGGRMVHSPTTGDVVKISPVWWSRFYGATRLFEPVKAPPTPTAGPSVTPSASASASATATPSVSASASASATPSASATATPTDPATPTASPAAPTTTPPSPSPSASPQSRPATTGATSPSQSVSSSSG